MTADHLFSFTVPTDQDDDTDLTVVNHTTIDRTATGYVVTITAHPILRRPTPTRSLDAGEPQ